jgi:hypothetical protein
MIRAMLVCLVPLASCWLPAQSAANPDQPKAQAEITNAHHVTYPPIATAARVSGEVVLKVHLRADGLPSDVSVVSGPQILRGIAIEGAQKNTYLCRSCTESGAEVDLTYSFKLGPAIGCGEGGVDSSYPRFTHSGDIITIEAQPYLICDPAAEVSRVRARSAKCLFLWHCGWSRPTLAEGKH